MNRTLLIVTLLLININLFSASPDTCLKVYDYPYDSTFTNPYLVKVDSCTNSSIYGCEVVYADFAFNNNFVYFECIFMIKILVSLIIA